RLSPPARWCQPRVTSSAQRPVPDDAERTLLALRQPLLFEGTPHAPVLHRHRPPRRPHPGPPRRLLPPHASFPSYVATMRVWVLAVLTAVACGDRRGVRDVNGDRRIV